MSYYIARRISVKKGGKITISAADSSLRPLHWFISEYKGTVADLLYSINKGNIQPYRNANKTIQSVSDAISEIEKMVGNKGLTWDEMFRYKLKDRDEIIRYACECYADRVLRNDWSDPEGFAEKLGTVIADKIIEGLKSLKEAKEKDKLEGVIRISCAAYSLWDGYDLLMPYESKCGWILAPTKDYHGGELRTDFKNIIPLGEESEDLYAYLSFDGANISLEEYLAKARNEEEKKRIRDKFARVDKIVQMVRENGLSLPKGKQPYKGYLIQETRSAKEVAT